MLIKVNKFRVGNKDVVEDVAYELKAILYCLIFLH